MSTKNGSVKVGPTGDGVWHETTILRSTVFLHIQNVGLQLKLKSTEARKGHLKDWSGNILFGGLSGGPNTICSSFFCGRQIKYIADDKIVSLHSIPWHKQASVE